MGLITNREPVPFKDRVEKFDSRPFGSTLLDKAVIGVFVLFSLWAISNLVVPDTGPVLEDRPAPAVDQAVLLDPEIGP